MIVCSSCKKEYTGASWRCECGGPLEVTDEERFHVGRLKDCHSLWRYEPYLGTRKRVSFEEGWTPLVTVDSIFYKLDFLFCTGSFKDRGSTVMVSHLQERGITRVVEDSSGNAGASVAAYAARAHIAAEIYVPAYASPGKVFQIEAFGAEIHKVKGTREDTRKEAMKRAEHVYYASHQWNPFFLEGMKTVAYELAEQFDWDVPSAVVLPVGSGSLYYGVVKGFLHLYESGVIGVIPEVVGVQPERCCPVYNAVHGVGGECGRSIAEGLLVENPPRLKEIAGVVKKHGRIMTVSEDEIKEGLRKALQLGLFIEPTSAVVMAALEKVSSDKTVVILTGTGLKAAETVRELL